MRIDNFLYLSAGGNHIVDGVNDADELKETMKGKCYLKQDY